MSTTPTGVPLWHDDDPTDRGLSPAPEPHACDRGWIDRDDAVPCLTCRPWLRRDTTERNAR